VEEVFGAGKRKYSLKLIMARLVCGAQALILMAFLVMCAEKILRLLRLFFVLIISYFCNLLRLCTSAISPCKASSAVWGYLQVIA
jgi:hypothetical protein